MNSTPPSTIPPTAEQQVQLDVLHAHLRAVASDRQVRLIRELRAYITEANQ